MYDNFLCLNGKTSIPNYVQLDEDYVYYDDFNILLSVFFATVFYKLDFHQFRIKCNCCETSYMAANSQKFVFIFCFSSYPTNVLNTSLYFIL